MECVFSDAQNGVSGTVVQYVVQVWMGTAHIFALV